MIAVTSARLGAAPWACEPSACQNRVMMHASKAPEAGTRKSVSEAARRGRRKGRQLRVEMMDDLGRANSTGLLTGDPQTLCPAE